MSRDVEIRAGDVLVVKLGADDIDGLVGALKLEYARGKSAGELITGGDPSLMEVVAPEGARIVGRSALSLRLLARHGVTLLGVSRTGRRFTDRPRKLKIEAGDVLLLLGPTERLPEIARWLGCLPLAERGLQVIRRDRARLAVLFFGGAGALATAGVLYLPVALACAVALMVLFDIVPLREVYESVEWPVIVLLGSMIPLGGALEHSGGTSLVAEGITTLTAGFGPAVVLVFLMIVTMTLSDVMNNTATAVIAAPIAVDVATRLGVNPDPYLMGVAVAASCAFLTPIGHKNNTLILGPGGYEFGDYWRMGLPLEILIILIATPMILLVWPL
jgi:di/tricarboxylate transporter